AEGRALFHRFCMRCHGADGRGAADAPRLPGLPDFTRRAWHEPRSDSQLVASILDGKGSAMPAFHGKIGNGQARALVAYLRSFDLTRPPPTAAATAASDGFEARFRALQDEFDDLGRQIRALAPQTTPTRSARR